MRYPVSPTAPNRPLPADIPCLAERVAGLVTNPPSFSQQAKLGCARLFPYVVLFRSLGRKSVTEYGVKEGKNPIATVISRVEGGIDTG